MINQILVVPNDNSIEHNDNPSVKHKSFKVHYRVSVILLFFSVFYFINKVYSNYKNEEFSKVLLNYYTASTVYSETPADYVVNLSNKDDTFSVIGIIEINKIGVKYPILSDMTDHLLTIAPCRFYGPMPNEIGNLAIASHNYEDTRFFSKLYTLKAGDTINIYDNSKKKISYVIYRIFETNADDVSSALRTTSNTREVTLVTCNNINGNRLIVKAKEQQKG